MTDGAGSQDARPCVCGEINTRHCPVHGQGEVAVPAETIRRAKELADRVCRDPRYTHEMTDEQALVLTDLIEVADALLVERQQRETALERLLGGEFGFVGHVKACRAQIAEPCSCGFDYLRADVQGEGTDDSPEFFEGTLADGLDEEEKR